MTRLIAVSSLILSGSFSVVEGEEAVRDVCAAQIEESETAIAATPAGQPESAPGAWWGDRTAGLFGGIGGSIIGCLGALMGTLASLGRGRRLVLSLAITMPFCGAACLVLGIVAVGAGQPYAVYYPLLLGGIIMTVVFAGCLPTVRKRYEEIELRKMTAMDVGARS